MKLSLDKRNIVPAYIIAAMWYMVSLNLFPEAFCAIFKVIPLILLVIALAGRLKVTTKPEDRKTLILPIVALSLSMVGDVFGDVKPEPFKDLAFMLQMLFFMAAHFVYIGSFYRFMMKPHQNEHRPADNFGRLMVVLFMVVLMIFLSDTILPVLNDSKVLRLGVSGYMVIITVMVLSSVMQNRGHVWNMILGAVLFAVSDAIIALTAFMPSNTVPLAIEDTLVFLTYYTAQILINVGLVPKSNSQD